MENPHHQVELLPALEGDCTVLTQVESAAFAVNNPLSDLMFEPLNDRGVAVRSRALAESMREDPTARYIKAVLDGRTVGWAEWHFHLEPRPVEPWTDREEWPGARNREACNEFFGSIARKRNEFMGGKSFVLLSVLVTLPEYQGRGIGSRLLRTGLEEVERAGIPAWLEASERGYPLYRKFGFEDVSDIVMNLSKYGAAGTYRTVCMLFPAIGKLN